MGEIILSCLIANIITLIFVSVIFILIGYILYKKYIDNIKDIISDTTQNVNNIISEITSTTSEVKNSMNKIKEFLDKWERIINFGM